jgi:hypothetical protein
MKGLISNTYLVVGQQIYDLITVFGPPRFIFFINNDLFDSGLLVTVSKLFLFLTWCVRCETGNPRVNFPEPLPIPVNTIPLQIKGTVSPYIAWVHRYWYGFYNNHGI